MADELSQGEKVRRLNAGTLPGCQAVTLTHCDAVLAAHTVTRQPARGTVSYVSPIARAVLGGIIGETVEVPGGAATITEIK